jgi:thiamine biosynthesis lipoprotein
MLAGILVLANLLGSSPVTLADSERQPKLKRFDFVEMHMGVDFRVRLYAPHAMLANNAAKAAFARVKQLNGLLSDYESTSEVRRLCEMPTGKPTRISLDLFNVLQSSQKLSKSTDGAFDVTVGPLTKLWRRAHRRRELPDKKLLATALKAVGFQFVVLDPEAHTATITRPNVRIDLGGIAKGYAVDEALKVLAEHGINRALVDGSGDIAIGDPPPGCDAWVVSVASLDQPDSKSAATLSLRNCAVATSGDAFQHVEIGGRRYSHIVNPKTGFGLSQSSSVTIIAPNGMLADSLASAVSVMGPKLGVQFIDSKKNTRCEALVLISKNPNAKPASIETFRSKSFSKFVNRKSP